MTQESTGSFKPKQSEGKASEPAPTGVHMARCIGMVDLGTQPGGKFADKPKLLIFYELTETNHVFDEDKGEQPFVVNMKFSNVISNFKGKESGLYKHMKAWGGPNMTEDKLKDLDLFKFLKYGCQLSIQHTAPNESGKVYANVVAIMPLATGQKPAQPRNKLMKFNIDDVSTHANFKDLYPWVQKAIAESPEWKQIVAKGGAPATSKPLVAEAEEEEPPF